jgi:hypothetical protein
MIKLQQDLSTHAGVWLGHALHVWLPLSCRCQCSQGAEPGPGGSHREPGCQAGETTRWADQTMDSQPLGMRFKVQLAPPASELMPHALMPH